MFADYNAYGIMQAFAYILLAIVFLGLLLAAFKRDAEDFHRQIDKRGSNPLPFFPKPELPANPPRLCERCDAILLSRECGKCGCARCDVSTPPPPISDKRSSLDLFI